jgi:hypothetical protein
VVIRQGITCTQARTGNIEPAAGGICEPRQRHIVVVRTTTKPHRRSAAWCAWLAAIARGQSGSPYDWLLAIGGLAYLLAVAWFRWRG